MDLREPYTPDEFKKYFHARWKVLREPWGFEEGSEIDDQENISLHVMAIENEVVAGVGRLTYLPDGLGQIRYMGVKNEFRNKQIGKGIIEYLEKEAKNLGITMIFLNARKEALDFYKKMGYKSEGKEFEGIAGIPHTKMIKDLF